MSETRYYRIQLDFNPSDFAEIDRLVTRLKLRSTSRLLASGIQLVSWMDCKKDLEEGRVGAILPDGRFAEPLFEFMGHPSPDTFDHTDKQKSSASKVRVQFDLSQDCFDHVNGLKTKLKLPTRAELYRSGLLALSWMVKKRDERCPFGALIKNNIFIEPDFDFARHLPEPLRYHSVADSFSAIGLGLSTSVQPVPGVTPE